MRLDAIPPTGGPPGSDPAFVIEDLVDRFGLAAAILNGQPGLFFGGFPDPDVARVLSSAHNEWLAAEWLDYDPRFKGSIVVGPRDPASAVEEIARWASHPSMVQVYLPTCNIRLGDRHFWPIFEAAEHYGLPVCVHPGGEGIGVNEGLFPIGPPTYYFEFHASLSLPYQAQLISLIGAGVFERFPDLKVVFCEGGFAWLIETVWRLDQKWHALRDDVPWLSRLPSEYVRDHVRVTSQPMYEPARKEHLHHLLEMVDASDILCFSSDYPHWDTDDPVKALSVIPAALRQRMMQDTPRALYNLPAGDA
jgi:predicted TIM-barrel fold metal-dependent hydrolase